MYRRRYSIARTGAPPPVPRCEATDSHSAATDCRAITRPRDPKANLLTSFTKIIEKAGHKAWPRLFHNLRASFGTDWADRVPVHSVAAWLGHSPTISAKHYLQSRDARLDLVTGRGAAANPATVKATDTPQARPKKTRPTRKSLNNRPILPFVGARLVLLNRGKWAQQDSNL